MPKYRYSRDPDFLLRLAREHLRNSGERNGVSGKDIMAPDGKNGGTKGGETSVEPANAATASLTRWSGIGASTASDKNSGFG